MKQYGHTSVDITWHDGSIKSFSCELCKLGENLIEIYPMSDDPDEPVVYIPYQSIRWYSISDL